MMDEIDLKLEKVDQATLELLERRLEARIRSNFQKSVTIPIAGGGILGMLAVLFVWIPSQVTTRINQVVSESVSAEVAKQTESYFRQPEFKTSLDHEVQRHTSARIEMSIDEALPKAVAKAVAARDFAPDVADFLSSDAATELLTSKVTSYLETHEDVIVRAVDQALGETARRIGQTIQENRNRLVDDFDADSLDIEAKQAAGFLYEFINPENIEAKQSAGKPIVLSKTITPRASYAVPVIDEYLREFRRAFGPLFKYIAILHQHESGDPIQFIALIPQAEFGMTFDEIGQPFVALLNSDASPARAREQIANWFGPGVLTSIQTEWSASRALTDSQVRLGPEIENHAGVELGIDDSVAVLSGGQLTAVTTRRQLIRGLIKPRE